MKNIRIFIKILSVFADEIFNIFEWECFHNAFLEASPYNWLSQSGVINRFKKSPDNQLENIIFYKPQLYMYFIHFFL